MPRGFAGSASDFLTAAIVVVRRARAAAIELRSGRPLLLLRSARPLGTTAEQLLLLSAGS